MGFRAALQYLAAIHEATASLLREMENPHPNRQARLEDFAGKILAAAQRLHTAVTSREVQ